MNEQEFRSGTLADGSRLMQPDQLDRIHERGKAALLAHIHKMQDMADAYLEDHGTLVNTRNREFANDMVYMLDGPEQRAVEALARNPLDYPAEAALTLSPQFHGELVSKSSFNIALTNAIGALEQLDKIKKALFYGKGEVGKHDMSYSDVSDLPVVIGDATNLTDQEAANYLHGVIGIATEAGELLEGLRDLLRGKSLDGVNLKEECGDAKWYMAILSRLPQPYGFLWGEDETVNIAKLRARFPNAFTEYDAQNRKLEREYKILSGESDRLVLCVGVVSEVQENRFTNCEFVTIADSDGTDGA